MRVLSEKIVLLTLAATLAGCAAAPRRPSSTPRRPAHAAAGPADPTVPKLDPVASIADLPRRSRFAVEVAIPVSRQTTQDRYVRGQDTLRLSLVAFQAGKYLPLSEVARGRPFCLAALAEKEEAPDSRVIPEGTTYEVLSTARETLTLFDSEAEPVVVVKLRLRQQPLAGLEAQKIAIIDHLVCGQRGAGVKLALRETRVPADEGTDVEPRRSNPGPTLAEVREKVFGRYLRLDAPSGFDGSSADASVARKILTQELDSPARGDLTHAAFVRSRFTSESPDEDARVSRSALVVHEGMTLNLKGSELRPGGWIEFSRGSTTTTLGANGSQKIKIPSKERCRIAANLDPFSLEELVADARAPGAPTTVDLVCVRGYVRREPAGVGSSTWKTEYFVRALAYDLKDKTKLQELEAPDLFLWPQDE